MPILPVSVHYQQNRGNPSLDGDSSDHMPSLFTGFARAVRSDKTAFVLKDQGRQFE